MFVLIAGFLLLYFFVIKKKNKNNSCTTDKDCTIPLSICYKGQCCSPSCEGKNCDQMDGCGGSCEQAVCGLAKKCYQGNCCTPQCDGITCGQDDGCGGTCGCSPEQTCYEYKCCTPQVCDGTFCSSEGVCGNLPCKCNENLGECINNVCTYDDICDITDLYGMYLTKQWARFCQKDSTGAPTCTNCSLTQAVFDGDATVPVSGVISCDSCDKSDGTKGAPQQINIDKDVGYYYNDNGTLTAGKTDYCSGNCGNCVCITDDDCIRFGCTKCVNQNCQ
jgi:hypothetical protein